MTPSAVLDVLSEREKLFRDEPIVKIESEFGDKRRKLIVNGKYHVVGPVFNQLCDAMHVPSTFLRRTDPKLAEEIVARLAPSAQKTHLLLAGSVPARVFNEKLPYTKPTDVVKKIFDSFAELDDCELDAAQIEAFHIGFRSAKTVAEPQVGDMVKGGVNFRFSEYGLVKPSVVTSSYRLSCTNGATYSDFMRSIDVSEKNYDDMITTIVASIAGGLEAFDKIVGPQMKASAGVTVDPMQAIRRLSVAHNLNKSMLDRVLAAYSMEPMPTMWGVSNAFTRAANMFTDQDDRAALQNIGGGVVKWAEQPHCTSCAAAL